METITAENTRVAYEDVPSHAKIVTGHFPIPQSPFTESEQVAAALQFVQGGQWIIQEDHIGGLGDVHCAANKLNQAAEILWQDARGGWWIQVQIMAGIWLPALDKTEELAQKSRKPTKTCRIHNGSLSDFACLCGRCAVDQAATRRWEVNVKMRCAVCGHRFAYCEC